MHYSLLAICDGTKTLEAMMDPFRETFDLTTRNEYFKFVDDEEDLVREYEHERQPMVMVDGEWVSKYDERFYVQPDDCFGWTPDGIRIPDGLVVEDVPHKDLYATFDEFVHLYHGDSRDESTGRYGHWENPNAKWDWYVVGGRWCGLLEAKIGGFGKKRWYDFRELRADYGFERRDPYPDRPDLFDVARVVDVTHVDPWCIHSLLTPDGVWRDGDEYHPEGLPNGHYFKETGWQWRDGLLDRLKSRYADCMAYVVDYHT